MKKTGHSIRKRVSSLFTSLTRVSPGKGVALPGSVAVKLENDHVSALQEQVEKLASQVAMLSVENERLRASEAQLKEALRQCSIPDAEHDYMDDILEVDNTPELRQRPTIESINTTKAAVRYSRFTELSPVSESEEGDLELSETHEDDTSTIATAVVSTSDRSSTFMNVAVLDLSGYIERKTEYPLHGGGYADIHHAALRNHGEERDVAVKVIRAHTYTEVNRWKIDKRLRREIRVWACLTHPNVVPLLGTTYDFGPYISMVCPWMADGDLHHYLKDNRQTLTLSTRLKMLADIAEGLCYLHSQYIVHGDLTTANILIDKGKALLSDFGLSNILPLRHRETFISSTIGGAVRWAAPELYIIGPGSCEILPELSKPCDIYSFGSIMLHTISGEIPYADIASNVQVVCNLMKGKHPQRPSEPSVTDDFWHFMTLCWKPEGYDRPDASAVRQRLDTLRSNCSEDLLRSTISLGT